MKQTFSAPSTVAVYEKDLLPDRDEITQLLSAAARPFVIATDRELSVLRRGLTKDGWKRSLYLQDAPPEMSPLAGVGLLARANGWLAEDIRIPEPAGSYQDFFCDDGSMLEVPTHPSWGTSEFRCPACGRTYGGEKFESAFRWFLHNALAHGCLALALVYQLDRDVEYAEKATEILRGYAGVYPRLSAGRKSSGVMSCITDEAQWVIPLAQAYDLVYHAKALAHGDRSMIENGLFRTAAGRISEEDREGSDGTWQVAAVGVIGAALKDADLLGFALDRFPSQVRYEPLPNQSRTNPIQNCHFSTLAALVHLAEACSRTGVDLYSIRPTPDSGLKPMFMGCINCAYPSFYLPSEARGRCSSVLPLSLYEVAYRRWGNQSFAWMLKSGYGFAQHPINETQALDRSQFIRGSLYAFIFGRDLPGRVQPPKIESAVFPGLGMCTIRSDGAMLTLSYGAPREEAQAGGLGITFYAKDRLLLTDYGMPGSGSAAAAEYYRCVASKNAVVVDGKLGSSTCRTDLSLFRPGDYMQIAEARAEDVAAGVRQTRRVVLAGDVLLIGDSLASESTHAYDWLLSSEGDLVDVPAPAAADVENLSELFTNSCNRGTSSEFGVRWQDGHAGLAVCVVMDGSGTLITARRPAETTTRTIPVIDLRRTAESARFTAVCAPYAVDVPNIEWQGNAVKVSRGNTVDWISTAGVPRVKAADGEMETDAEVAAVREVDGAVVACALYRGSYIKLKGEMILLGASIFERVEVRLDSRNPTVSFEGASGEYLRIKCSARAMRVNGHRISAANFDGMASIRLVGVLAT